MHAERDHLVRFVFPELKERCRKRHIQLIDVDLRWGVTEADVIQSSGYGVLDTAARNAVLEWTFKNVTANIEVRIPIRFILTDR